MITTEMAMIAMIAMVIRSSIRVKPPFEDRRVLADLKLNMESMQKRLKTNNV